MADKKISELTTLSPVDNADWVPVVDVSDTSDGPGGTTKKASRSQFKGDTGDAGPEGPVGPEGPAGDDGADGADGADGMDGADGADAFVYIAYASDDTGTGFTTTFNPALDFIAIKSTTSPIVSPAAGDFAGLWKYYKGADGSGGGSPDWGDIGGTLSDQTDLQAALNSKVETLADLGITASAGELNHVDGVTSAIQTQLDAKQPLDADLTAIAALTATTDNFIQAKGSAWASRTIAQVKTDLGLSGTNTGDQTLPVKASGGEVDTGTDDAKFVTAKAMEDSSYIKAAYADGKVADAINDGATTVAPSQNAVFDALALKAPLASPALTGTPTAPTPTAADNSTKIATTAYADAKVADAINDGTTGVAPSQNAVFDALALKAPLASPSFTGTVAAAKQVTTGLSYGAEYDNGNSGAADTIDWAANGNFQRITITANTTLTFTAPTGPAALVLKVIHESGNSNAYTVAFSPTLKKPAAATAYTAVTPSSGAYDILNFFYDGAGNYNYVPALNMG